MSAYTYDRKEHLPNILHVPNDWLCAQDGAITRLIVARLEKALKQQGPPPLTPRLISLQWALHSERQQLRN